MWTPVKIGILGGTFNPIHNSHIYLARQFYQALGLDELLLIPTYTPPHKEAADLAAPAHRLAMCGLAAQAEGFAVCDYEINRAEKSYSYKTLAYLAEQYPGAELFFLMGADMFLTVQHWYKTQEIYRYATLCAAARQPQELAALQAHQPLLEAQGARTVVLPVEAKPLSSTEIRAKAGRGESIDDLVPPAVAEYIKAYGLYGGCAGAV